MKPRHPHPLQPFKTSQILSDIETIRPATEAHWGVQAPARLIRGDADLGGEPGSAAAARALLRGLEPQASTLRCQPVQTPSPDSTVAQDSWKDLSEVRAQEILVSCILAEVCW